MENVMPEFEITESMRMVQEMARNFAQQEIKPTVMKYDESQEFPFEIMKKLGELGFLGVIFPEEYGGAGFGYLEYITIIEEISKVDPSIGLSIAAHNSLCTNHIFTFGNEEQKRKYIPDLATGKKIGAWALTEPTSGSDARSDERTGMPAAIASRTGRPKPSYKDGKTRRSAPESAASRFAAGSQPVKRTPGASRTGPRGECPTRTRS